jgi:hypothetical protein
MTARPAISFGIIVLNGEPFTRPNLRALYPFAHQIIVAEGASPKAAHAATPDGHSIDGTLEVLRRFKAEEDPEDKLLIVTAEDEGHPNGFWPGEKDQQSQAYARRATGEWLWQIDIDEFYHPRDMERVLAYLWANPRTSCLTFEAHHFWGGFDYVAEGGLFGHRRFQGELWGVYRRVFRWGPGYRYLTHRPPTVADASGRDITRSAMRCISRVAGEPPVRMYHYFMLLPSQFTRKGTYYQNQPWPWERGRLRKNEAVLREVTLANGLSILDHHGTRNWLARFTGEHPPQIAELRADIAAGRVAVELRRTDDIERLLADPAYARAIRWQAPRERLRNLWVHALYLGWYAPRSRLGHWLLNRLPTRLRTHLPRIRARQGSP